MPSVPDVVKPSREEPRVGQYQIHGRTMLGQQVGVTRGDVLLALVGQPDLSAKV
jgi:hypothetical protein